MNSPQVAIAAPVYGQARHLRAALGSILAQTERDLSLLVLDDCSPDETFSIARELARSDDRVVVERNPRKLGMLDNTRRAWARAQELYPGARFWALASDHDLWDDRWLERLLAALQQNASAVLAYPVSERVDERSEPICGVRTWHCETVGITDPARRLRRAYRCMVAGDMVYGLFRVEALRQVGHYRSVLVPDRLLLAELALSGEFVQVPELLWRRRYTGLADLERQRRAFWPDGRAPIHARLPWWWQHAGLVAWERVVLGRRGPRRAGGALAWTLLREGARLRAVRRVQSVRRRLGAILERPARAAMGLDTFRAAVRDHRLPVPPDTQEVLDRLLTEWAKRERSGSRRPPGRIPS
jgi:glycosyltransferase involved in cell wall biosynthesis